MAGKISELAALTGAALATGDKFEVNDVSAGDNKSITKAELLLGLGLDTTQSPQFTGLNIGHATDTTLTRVSAGVVAVEGATLITDVSELTIPHFGRGRKNSYFFEDFFLDVTAGYSAVVSGTGAAATYVAPQSGRFGVVRGDLGTTTTGRVRVSTVDTAGLTAGFAQLSFDSSMALNTLSTTAERYSCRLGFIDSGTGESTDGMFFRYDSEVNGGEWECVCRAAGVETAVDSNILPVAGTYYLFEIIANAAGTSVVFKINGTTVATITTNIPTGANAFGWGVMALKSAGTTATSSFLIDLWEVEIAFAAAR